MRYGHGGTFVEIIIGVRAEAGDETMSMKSHVRHNRCMFWRFRNTTYFIFTLIMLVCLPFYAQAVDVFGVVSLFAIPEQPGPNSQVTLRVESSSADVNRSTIIWAVNGKVVASAIGKTTFTLTTGAIGSQTTVSVSVKEGAQPALSETLVFRPASVDVWWQADSRIPELYPGKGLHASQSNLTIVAFPQLTVAGKRVPPEKLVYSWKHNNKPLVEQSGYGKNVLSVRGAKRYGADTVAGGVSTLDNAVRAEKSITITTIDPEIIFYQERPLAGTDRANAVPQNISSTAPAPSFRAGPYFVTRSDLA